MSDYGIIETSAEVWRCILSQHRDDLTVFSSFSDPYGGYTGCTQGRMETTYGFKGCDYPIMEAKTTWDIDPAQPFKRTNEKHQYWICLPIKELEE